MNTKYIPHHRKKIIATGDQWVLMTNEKLCMTPSLKTMDDFKEWLYETEIWKCLTDLDKKKL